MSMSRSENERGDIAGKRAALHCLRGTQHVCKARVQRQLRHGAAGSSDTAL